jgi:AcrR family transcriptional regulator
LASLVTRTRPTSAGALRHVSVKGARREASSEMDAEATRGHIVRAADDLFYRQGFQHTSFADIADEVGISRGNFYYHFKTKDEILAAVIEARIAERHRMLRQWEDEQPTPAGRIRCYINIVITNGADIENYGCPVGTLTTELSKLGHGSLESATEIFTLFRTWLREQFTALGRADDADELAMHVLAFSQGIATMSNAYSDREFVRREVGRLTAWVDAQAAQAV